MLSIEADLKLALALENNPGIYTLLLGSGISKSSRIPTGWDIVRILIRMTAKLKEEEVSEKPE